MVEWMAANTRGPEADGMAQCLAGRGLPRLGGTGESLRDRVGVGGSPPQCATGPPLWRRCVGPPNSQTIWDGVDGAVLWTTERIMKKDSHPFLFFTPDLFFFVPRNSGRVHIWFSASREPHDANASRARVIRAVDARMSLGRCRAGRGCELVVHKGSAKHLAPVLEPHRIPLEHTGLILPILVRVIFIEERVPEALLFGLPSCTFQRRPRPRALPLAPFNARCYGFGRIGHSSPPLLDPASADDAARRPLISGTPSVTWHKGCQGINASCPVPGAQYVPISCRGSIARPGDDDRILDKGRVGEYVGLRIHPRQPIRLDRIGVLRRGITGFRQKSRAGCSTRMV